MKDPGLKIEVVGDAGDVRVTATVTPGKDVRVRLVADAVADPIVHVLPADAHDGTVDVQMRSPGAGEVTVALYVGEDHAGTVRKTLKK